MKLAVATCVAIAVCLGSLAVRHRALHAPAPGADAPAAAATGPAVAPAAPVAAPAGRTAPRLIEKRALASIDRHLRRKLRKLAKARVAAHRPAR